MCAQVLTENTMRERACDEILPLARMAADVELIEHPCTDAHVQAKDDALYRGVLVQVLEQVEAALRRTHHETSQSMLHQIRCSISPHDLDAKP